MTRKCKITTEREILDYLISETAIHAVSPKKHFPEKFKRKVISQLKFSKSQPALFYIDQSQLE